MTQFWRDLVSDARYVDGIEISQFDSSVAELRAAADGKTVLAPLPHLSVIRCSGDDAASFLHNQLTSDITHLSPGFAQHSAWCTAKGRMLASFVVVHDTAGFALICATDLAATVFQRLQRFVLRAKVKLSMDADAELLFGLAGKEAEASLKAAGLPVPDAALQLAEFSEGRVLHLDEERYILLLDADSAKTSWNSLSASALPVGTPVWRWLDVRAALPLISAATSEEFVPQMANFQNLGGISFHKGCYPGQEIVARTQYLGKVKRHLYRVQAAEVLRVGESLYGGSEPDVANGMVVVAAPSPDGGSVGLAVLQEAAAAGEVRIGAGADALKLQSLQPVVT